MDEETSKEDADHRRCMKTCYFFSEVVDMVLA